MCRVCVCCRLGKEEAYSLSCWGIPKPHAESWQSEYDKDWFVFSFSFVEYPQSLVAQNLKTVYYDCEHEIEENIFLCWWRVLLPCYDCCDVYGMIVSWEIEARNSMFWWHTSNVIICRSLYTLLIVLSSNNNVVLSSYFRTRRHVFFRTWQWWRGGCDTPSNKLQF